MNDIVDIEIIYDIKKYILKYDENLKLYYLEDKYKNLMNIK
jgi:hypothetical protein